MGLSPAISQRLGFSLGLAVLAACLTPVLIAEDAGPDTLLKLEQAHDTVDRNVSRLEQHVAQLRLQFAAALQQEQQAFEDSLNSDLQPGVGALRVKEARLDVEEVSAQLDEAEDQLEQTIAKRNVLQNRLKLKVGKERANAGEEQWQKARKLETEEEARLAAIQAKREAVELQRLATEEGTRESAKDEAWRAVLAATLAAPEIVNTAPDDALKTYENQRPSVTPRKDATGEELRSLREETNRQAQEMRMRHVAAAQAREESKRNKAARMAAQEKYLRQFREHDADARRFALKNLAIERTVQVDPAQAVAMQMQDHEEELRQQALLANQVAPAVKERTTIDCPPAHHVELSADAFRYVKANRMKGECEVRTQEGYVAIEVGREYPLGSVIRTGNHSFVDFEFIPNTGFRVQPNTTVEVTEGTNSATRKTLYLHRGTLKLELDSLPEGHFIDVETYSTAISARDARYSISYEDASADIPYPLKNEPRMHRFEVDRGEIEVAARHVRPDGRKSFGQGMILRIEETTEVTAILQDSPGSYYADLAVDRGTVSVLHGEQHGPRATIQADAQPTHIAVATIHGTTVPAFGLDVREGQALFAFRDGDEPTSAIERRHGASVVTRSGYFRHHEAAQIIDSARDAGSAYAALQQLHQVRANERRMESQTRRVERAIERLAKTKTDADKVITNTEVLAASGGLSFDGELDDSEWLARNEQEAEAYAVKMAAEAERQAEMMQREAELKEAANRHRLLVEEEERKERIQQAAALAQMEQELRKQEFAAQRERYLRRYNAALERDRKRMDRKSEAYRKQMERYLEDADNRQTRREELDQYERDVDLAKLNAMQSAARKRIADENRAQDVEDRKDSLETELRKLDSERRELSASRHAALRSQEESRKRYELEKAKYLERVALEREREEARRNRLQERELNKFRRDEDRYSQEEQERAKEEHRKKGWIPFL